MDLLPSIGPAIQPRNRHEKDDNMIPIHTHTYSEVIRAEREREYQKASLRRLARAARRDRTSTLGGTWMARVLSIIRGQLHRESAQGMLQEPVEVPYCDR